MSYKKILTISIFIALIAMVSSVSAASMQMSINTYDTAVYKNSQFSVPVSVTLDNGSGTASVTISPKNGLRCDSCTSNIVFEAAGTKSASFTIYADNAGSYETPFTVQATMAGISPVSASASNTIIISEMPSWTLDFSKSKSSVIVGDSVTLTLSISVTDTIEGITTNLDLPSGWSLTTGNESYGIETVTGTQDMSWVIKADSPSTSNVIGVDIIATTPSKADTKTLSIAGPTPPPNNGNSGTTTSPSIGGATPISAGKTNATNKPTLVPGLGLMENTKLKLALENVWGNKNMSQDAIDNMMRISEAISSQISMEREINVASGKSNMHTSLRYNGKNQIKDFVLYDIVPKSFAQSAKDITVTASGARVEIVEDDPEFAIIFDTVSPGETLFIDYVVNAEIDADIVSSFTSEVYASEVVVEDKVCAQVMTPAINPATDECVVYSTPCDVPEGWDVVVSCPIELLDDVESTGNNIYKYIIALALLGIVGLVVVLHKTKKQSPNKSEEIHENHPEPLSETKSEDKVDSSEDKSETQTDTSSEVKSGDSTKAKSEEQSVYQSNSVSE